MPKKAMDILTESMFYVLLALMQGEMCGTDAAACVEERTRGRVILDPATLYTVLGKFEKEKYIKEVRVEGRKRTYRITDKGRKAFEEELERLRQCVRDAEGGSL